MRMMGFVYVFEYFGSICLAVAPFNLSWHRISFLLHYCLTLPSFKAF
uniref:Uncharacterized protein n=1 Tax=Meloidogyne enterolobii TaxID=390850 RepID=A0A6V7WYL8_MELEN|nr:unnamed protein product [Meloidogyne enterolobii]